MKYSLIKIEIKYILARKYSVKCHPQEELHKIFNWQHNATKLINRKHYKQKVSEFPSQPNSSRYTLPSSSHLTLRKLKSHNIQS